jgi:hypothetical protein
MPKLFEHQHNKNDRAGYMYSMIIGTRPTEMPCQAGLHGPRIGLAEVDHARCRAHFVPNTHLLRLRISTLSGAPSRQERTRAQSTRARTWLASLVLAESGLGSASQARGLHGSSAETTASRPAALFRKASQLRRACPTSSNRSTRSTTVAIRPSTEPQPPHPA